MAAKFIEQPKTSDGALLYAIGDIHGRNDLLTKLLDKIIEDAGNKQYQLIFLGDYLDRGLYSRQVIERLISLPNYHVFLKGNHEEEALKFLEPKAGLKWLNYGGLETMQSYGIDAFNVDCPHTAWREALPQHHKDFIDNLKTSYQDGDYFFCHAGVHPKRKLIEQTQRDLLWSRDKFLKYKKPFEKIIVHGHTITPQVDQQPNRIGIDTGAYASGILTALRLEGTDQRLLQTTAYAK